MCSEVLVNTRAALQELLKSRRDSSFLRDHSGRILSRGEAVAFLTDALALGIERIPETVPAFLPGQLLSTSQKV